MYTLKFNPPQQQSPEPDTDKRKRQRNIIWFNPPYSKNVQTNIGREFLNLIENCFPPNHKLRKLFNKNNVKLSYSCSPNVKQIIDGHNKTVLRQNTPPEETTQPKTCNCRQPEKCPLEGECLVKEVVYQATITTAESTETDITLQIDRWIHVAMTWKRGISGTLKMYANGDKKFELVLDGKATLDFKNSGRSVFDIGLKKDTGDTVHAYLSDLVIFNRELPDHELKEQWVHSHALYKFI
ncbi:hypothetical protein ACROYT_G003495 [Oculina patagonica]